MNCIHIWLLKDWRWQKSMGILPLVSASESWIRLKIWILSTCCNRLGSAWDWHWRCQPCHQWCHSARLILLRSPCWSYWTKWLTRYSYYPFYQPSDDSDIVSWRNWESSLLLRWSKTENFKIPMTEIVVLIVRRSKISLILNDWFGQKEKEKSQTGL